MLPDSTLHSHVHNANSCLACNQMHFTADGMTLCIALEFSILAACHSKFQKGMGAFRICTHVWHQRMGTQLQAWLGHMTKQGAAKHEAALARMCSAGSTD